jgi:hypothetical protein
MHGREYATILKFETMSKHVGEHFQQAVKLTPTPIACMSRLGKQNNAKIIKPAWNVSVQLIAKKPPIQTYLIVAKHQP